MLDPNHLQDIPYKWTFVLHVRKVSWQQHFWTQELTQGILIILVFSMHIIKINAVCRKLFSSHGENLPYMTPLQVSIICLHFEQLLNLFPKKWFQHPPFFTHWISVISACRTILWGPKFKHNLTWTTYNAWE